jgi:hypothetical protein
MVKPYKRMCVICLTGTIIKVSGVECSITITNTANFGRGRGLQKLSHYNINEGTEAYDAKTVRAGGSPAEVELGTS